MQESLHTHNSEMKPSQGSYEALEAATQQSEMKEVEENKSSKKSLWKNWPLMSSIIVYCILSLHDMAYTEVSNIAA